MGESISDIDMNKTFSENLCTILDTIGFTEEFRRWSSEVVKTQEMLQQVNTGVNGASKVLELHGAGSSVDGTFRASLGSDIDHLYVIKALSIGEEEEEYDVAYFTVYDEIRHPGYVKLKANRRAKGKRETEFYNEDGDGYLTNQPKNDVDLLVVPAFREKSGPAFTSISETLISTGEALGMDEVYALRSLSWPKLALEWLERPRSHGWPSEDSMKVLSTMGCLVVPTGHPLSKGTNRHDLEWRLSFTLQEKHLMLNINDVQYKCYVLLKMIKQDIITPIMGKSLSSYHCKTSLFYTIEENEPRIWRRENLTECVCKCLRRLLEWAENGFCPNYFLPQSNLFHGKIDSKEMPKLVELLQKSSKTLSNFCASLESIKCERLGEWIRYIYSNLREPDKGESLRESSNQSLYLTVFCQSTVVACKLITCSREILQFSTVGLELFDIVEGHLLSLELLSLQYNQIDPSIRESLTPAIAYLHSSLASHLASKSIHAPPAEKDWYVCASALHFMHATELEPIVSRLKLATVLHMTGHNDSAKTILCQDVSQKIKSVEIFGGLAWPTMAIHMRSNKNSLLHNTLKEVIRMPVSQVLQIFWVGPVIFLPTEMNMTPHALRFEMFRSVATPSWNNEITSSLCRFFYGWAVVDAKTFHHFLCKQTGLYNSYYEFFSSLFDVKGQCHPETGFNIIGWVAKQSKCFHIAATAFLQSWIVFCEEQERLKLLGVVDDNQSQHNAAKLHMLVLLYDIWKNNYSLENEEEINAMDSICRNLEISELDLVFVNSSQNEVEIMYSRDRLQSRKS